MSKLKRFMICRTPEAILEGLDMLVERKFYESRSQAIRAAIVQLLNQTVWKPPDSQDDSSIKIPPSSSTHFRGIEEAVSPNEENDVEGLMEGERRDET